MRIWGWNLGHKTRLFPLLHWLLILLGEGPSLWTSGPPRTPPPPVRASGETPAWSSVSCSGAASLTVPLLSETMSGKGIMEREEKG